MRGDVVRIAKEDRRIISWNVCTDANNIHIGFNNGACWCVAADDMFVVTKAAG